MRADLFLADWTQTVDSTRELTYMADWTQTVDSTNESRLIFGRLDTDSGFN